MDKIELFENERARDYDQFVESWIPNYVSFLGMLPNLLKDSSQKEVLVAGCGTGNEIERLLNYHPSRKITGIDPSTDMILQAVDKFCDFPNVQLHEGVVGDLKASPIYSAVTLSLVLHFLKDNGEKFQLLKEIAERLKPGAPFIFLDITRSKQQLKQNLDILEGLLSDAIEEVAIQKRMERIQNGLFPVSEQRISKLCVLQVLKKPSVLSDRYLYGMDHQQSIESKNK